MEGKHHKINNAVFLLQCLIIIFRTTAMNLDLNRNFPDFLGAPLNPSTRAPETSAIMEWLDRIPFVLSANYHGGTFLINIPFDRYCKY